MERQNINSKPNVPGPKPDIYRYHDYREFLRDWIQFRKETVPNFSLRVLATEAKVALGFLSMGLSGKRSFSAETLSKMVKPLRLKAMEASYLELLRVVAESDDQEVRINALKRLQRSQAYRRQNPKETEAYRYLTHWYYVAIREMAGMKDFQASPNWIQNTLHPKIPLKDVQEALKFLTENGYVDVTSEGKAKLVNKNIECLGGVYRVAIAQYHTQMLGLAAQALHDFPLAERTVLGHTMAISKANYDEVQQVLEKALKEISVIGNRSKDPDTVYHIGFNAFPMTHTGTRGEK